MTNARIIGFSIKETKEQLSIGHTRLYELLGSGELTAVKLGRRTIVTAESLNRFIAQLPRADIKTTRRPAAKATE